MKLSATNVITHLLCFMLVIPMQEGVAQGVFRSNASGNWDVAGSWFLTSGSDADGIPDANDNVTIESHAINVTFATGNQACNTLTIRVTSTSTADGGLFISGSTLTAGGSVSFSRVGISANFHCDINISGSGRFNATANFLASRSNTDTRDRRLRVYVRNSGVFSVTGNFAYNYLNDRESQTEILLENSGQLNVTGNMTLYFGDGSGNNAGADEFLVNLNGGGSITCGNLIATIAGVNANPVADIVFRIDGGSVTTNNFSATHSGPSDDLLLYLNSVSTALPATLTVNGNMTLNHSSTQGDDMALQINANSTVNVTGNANFNINSSTDLDQIHLDMNGGSMSVGGLTTFYMAPAVTNSNIFLLINQATLNCNGGLNLNHYGGGGGDILVYLNNATYGGTTTAASLNVTGDMNIDHSLGDDIELQTNINSSVLVTGNFSATIYSVTGNDVLYFRLNDGTFTINGDMIVDFYGGGTLENLNIRINGSARLNIGNDAIWTMTTGGNIFLYLNQTSGTNAQFNVGRDLIISHDAAAADIMINPRQNSLFSVGGDFTVTHSAAGGDYLYLVMNNAPTVTIGGIMTFNMTAGASSSFDDMIIDMNGGSYSAGGVALTKSAGDIMWWDMDGGTATVTDDFTMTSDGGAENRIDLDNASVLNIDGNLIYDLNSTTSNNDVSRLYINENVGGTGGEVNIGGDLIVDHEGAAGDMQIYLNRDAQLIVAGNVTIDHDALGGDYCEIRLANNTNLIDVTGDFTMNLNSGAVGTDDDLLIDQNGGSITIDGNMTMKADAGDDTYLLIDNTGAMTVGGNLWLDHNAGDLAYIYLGRSAGSPVLTVNGYLSLDDAGGGTTELELNQSSVANVRENINLIAAAGSQTLIDLNTTSTLRIGGNFVRGASPLKYGTMDAVNGAIVKYDGSLAQIIAQDAGNGGDYFRYGGLTIANTLAGIGPHLNMEGPATVNGALLLTDGIAQTTAASLLVLADNATSSSGSAISFIDGPMRKIGNDAFTFPVGDISGVSEVWARLGMTAPALVATQFTTEYFYVAYSDRTVDATINNSSGIEYWRLDRAGSVSNVNITLHWEDASRSDIVDAASLDLVVARYNGTDWTDNGQLSITGLSPGTVGSTLVTTYNTFFTFGSKGGINPLPVELLNFHAEKMNENVYITWSTASETNSDAFSVERSSDGVSFEAVGTVNAAGNSTTQKNYGLTDRSPLNGLSYYRLKQSDMNGNFVYSSVKTVYFGDQNVISLFPNPASDYCTINLTGSKGMMTEISFFDVSGKKILSELVTPQSESELLTIDLIGKFVPGIFFVTISNAGQQVNSKIIIK